MEHGAEAERLGAEAVLADRLQHAAERRIHHAQQSQDHRSGAGENQIIGQHASVDFEAEQIFRNQHRARPQQFRQLKAAAVLAAGEP